MGIGDELMMAGEAQRRAAGNGARFAMLDKSGAPRWHPIWDGHPNIARPGERCDGEIGYVNRLRPYVAHESKERRSFRPYRPEPALLQLGPQALLFTRLARGAIVFNPAIKPRASPNKQWGIERWEELVRLAPDLRWIQVGESAAPRIRGADQLRTMNFRDAVGALKGAACAVLHEGALHHAAAAVRAPAIVIRGGYISPKVTGYAGQIDFYAEYADWPLGCGMRVPCAHCARAMASIHPRDVLAALRGIIACKKEVGP